MRVVILAAGMGMRLGENLPKPMTRLCNGRSILEQQVSAITDLPGFHETSAVVGFKKELVMEALPDLTYVYNPRFTQESTAKSLLRALRRVDDDVLWMNGDVVFHPTVLRAVVSQGRSCMVVNVGRTGDEEVKYRLDAQGKIIEVSKVVVGGTGEALGINFWKRTDVPLLRRHLEQCANQDYFERAIETSIGDGLEVWPLEVEQSQCVEVDFADDLKRANQLINSWGEAR